MSQNHGTNLQQMYSAPLNVRPARTHGRLSRDRCGKAPVNQHQFFHGDKLGGIQRYFLSHTLGTVLATFRAN